MHISIEQLEPRKIKLTVVAEPKELEVPKELALTMLGQNLKVPGFRSGKAPANLVEKQIDPSALQTEFLEQAVNQLYSKAINDKKLRPVTQPNVSITKFVPYSTLEFTAEIEAVGEIKLGDYKSVRITAKKIEVTAAEVDKVIDNLSERSSTKTEVKRAAKNGDEVTIDFNGTDSKTKEPIEGTDGRDYPLVLGSKNFIPGFEEELVGLKPKDNKTFEVTFPSDYGMTDLQNRKVTFEVTIKKIEELKPPKLDDAFAASLGPFKTMADLKADAKKQITLEKEQENRRLSENEILDKIAAQTDIAIPDSLVEDELDRLDESEKRDLTYRGQTWDEHLEAEGLTEAEHRERNRPSAKMRIKAGLILGEIAEQENISITPEDLKIRVELLKGQYPDQAMQSELDKPENQRDITGRMITERTLDLLYDSATSPKPAAKTPKK